MDHLQILHFARREEPVSRDPGMLTIVLRDMIAEGFKDTRARLSRPTAHVTTHNSSGAIPRRQQLVDPFCRGAIVSNLRLNSLWIRCLTNKEDMHAILLLPFYGLPSPRHYYQSMWHAGDRQCSQLKRIGNLGDGGKFVCMDALRDPIRVLSVGSQGDFTFENDILRHFPRAIITTMDGTVSPSVAARAPPNVSFVRSNFDSRTQVVNQLDILKIDCEGCELHALMPFLSRTCVFQILLETHACMQPLQRHHALMMKLNHSFGVFVKEPNIEFSDGTCVEFGLLRRQPCKSRMH